MQLALFLDFVQNKHGLVVLYPAFDHNVTADEVRVLPLKGVVSAELVLGLHQSFLLIDLFQVDTLNRPIILNTRQLGVVVFDVAAPIEFQGVFLPCDFWAVEVWVGAG